MISHRGGTMVKINYVSKADYQKMILQKGKKFFLSDSSEFYQVGENSILKDYQYEKLPAINEFLLYILESWKKTLIEQSKIFHFDELLKPEELWLVNGLLKGVTMPKLPEDVVEFEDYIYSCSDNLELICKKFTTLNTIFEKGSKLNLVFLDTITKGNLKIQPSSSAIFLCDGEGIQAGRVFPFVSSSLLNLEENDTIIEKYVVRTDKGVYAKTNLNRLAILTYFIKLCTRYVCITDPYPGMNSNLACELNLKGIGLEKDEILAPFIRAIYEKREIPRIEEDRWADFGHAYKLIPMGYGEKPYNGYAFRRR